MLLSKGFNQESGTKISKAIDVPLNIVNIQERMEQRSDITLGRIPSRKRNVIKEAARRPTGMLSELQEHLSSSGHALYMLLIFCMSD